MEARTSRGGSIYRKLTYRIKCARCRWGPDGYSQKPQIKARTRETPRRAGDKEEQKASSTAKLRGRADKKMGRREGKMTDESGGGERKGKKREDAEEGGGGRGPVEEKKGYRGAGAE